MVLGKKIPRASIHLVRNNPDPDRRPCMRIVYSYKSVSLKERFLLTSPGRATHTFVTFASGTEVKVESNDVPGTAMMSIRSSARLSQRARVESTCGSSITFG